LRCRSKTLQSKLQLYEIHSIIHPARSCGIAPNHVAPVAEKMALQQLRSARLLHA
jgi:hypothetical protein